MIWWTLLQHLHNHLATELPGTEVHLGDDAEIPDQPRINVIRAARDYDWMDLEQDRGEAKFYLELWGHNPDDYALAYQALSDLEDATQTALQSWQGPPTVLAELKRVTMRPDNDSHRPMAMNEWELSVEWFRTQSSW